MAAQAPSTPSSPEKVKRLNRRGFLTIATTFGVYAGLVSTHRGEFWPLSIFPMFSLAGRPWRRALMVELPPQTSQVAWTPTTLDALPGTPVSTVEVGVSTNDMSKFVQLTDSWDAEAIETLRELWRPVLEEGRQLLLLRADGHLDGETVVTEITPLVHIWDAGHAVNPTLESEPA